MLERDIERSSISYESNTGKPVAPKPDSLFRTATPPPNGFLILGVGNAFRPNNGVNEWLDGHMAAI
jgi:hypothetical protein